MTALNIFRLIDRTSSDPCLLKDAVYLPEGKWFAWSRIQCVPLDVVALKAGFGDIIPISLNFSGKILLRVGINREGHSFVWCAEKTLYSRCPNVDACHIDLSRVQQGTLEISLLALEESAVFDKRPIAEPIEKYKQQELYSFISPTYEMCCEEPLYYHFYGEHAYHSFSDSNVYLAKNTSIDLLTYFNSFSALKWKKYTNVDDLTIYIDFTGNAIVDVVHLTEKGSAVLAAWTLQAKVRTTLALPLGEYPADGIIGLRIYAEGPCVLYGGGYLTSSPETQSVRLGIGITTYRREESVKAAVASLGKAIDEHPLYRSAIDITVVDNGQSLTASDVSAATLIPNNNLGGAGGFMRNLIHYQDAGIYSHCLFMDDDAKCEPSAIFRSLSFIRHVNDKESAISGAMLSDTVQFEQWESGAYFTEGVCRRWHGDYDLRLQDVLLQNEKEDCPNELYAGWWFFLFPISKVLNYSFPFFVRGDDIAFSYTNPFKHIFLNGVASWQGSFRLKESPLIWYLNMRSHIIHYFMLNHLKEGRLPIIKMLWTFFYRFNCGYQYDTANSIVNAFSDVLIGPKYWIDNIDTSKIRSRIKKKYTIEAMNLLRADYKQVQVAEKNNKTPPFPKTFRILTLNGHLIPRCFLKKRLEKLRKDQLPFLNRVFLRKEILIYDNESEMGFTLKRNSRYFFKNIFYFLFVAAVFAFRYSSLQKKYKSFFKKFQTNDFWKNVFGAEK